MSYEDLLQLFWQSHDATHQAWKTQYASLILTHDEEQLAVAQHSAEQFSQLFGRPVQTRIEPLDHFYLAEDYHQKYYLQNEPTLSAEFRSMYPRVADLTESTAAARVNGYLHSSSRCPNLDHDLPLLGLSGAGGDILRARCAR